MSRELSVKTCDHCHGQFGYYLLNSGFDDSVYAYCDSCSRTAVLSLLDKRMPALGWRWQRRWSGLYCVVIENKKVENNFL